MSRLRPAPSQERRLLEANADRCSVCKRKGLGLNLHHIDGDSSNTVDANLAVLCVEHHDLHHRPSKYTPASKHKELGSAKLLALKASWEAFVLEARKPAPEVLATVTTYGTIERIHSIELVMQWPDERIEFVRAFHLRDGTLAQLTNEVISEVSQIGQHIKLALVAEPQPDENCSCCGRGFSHTMKPAVVARLTNSDWKTKSICSIYVNPHKASLALVFTLTEVTLFTGSLHLCSGKYLHYLSDGIDEPIELMPRPSVRTQAARIVDSLLKEWEPAHVFLGTGDEHAPTIIQTLQLPRAWEQRAANRLLVADTQPQNAALRTMLPAGQRQRYTA